jgi:hypothetical protein
MKFTWDPNKSNSNKKKHGIGFDLAKEVFEDSNAIVDKGKIKDGEERWITIGKTLKLFMIAIVFTIRDTTIRIISARQVQKKERIAYLKNALKNQSDVEINENK